LHAAVPRRAERRGYRGDRNLPAPHAHAAHLVAGPAGGDPDHARRSAQAAAQALIGYDRRMTYRFALAFLLAGSLACSAAAQTMEFGCPAPGTVIAFDSGIKVVSRGQDGMDCNMEEMGGKPFKIRALLISNPGPDGSNMGPFIAALRPERL